MSCICRQDPGVRKGDVEIRGDKGIIFFQGILSPYPNNPHISLLTLFVITILVS
jgi:hypothetical protein